VVTKVELTGNNPKEALTPSDLSYHLQHQELVANVAGFRLGFEPRPFRLNPRGD
jgi:hypothetical protein